MSISDGGSDGGGGSTGGICIVTPSDQVGSLDNIITRLTILETIVSQLLGTDITAIQLSDISQDAGDIFSFSDGVIGTAVGYSPYAMQQGMDIAEMTSGGTATDNTTLNAINGNTLLIPVIVHSKMRLSKATFRIVGNATLNITWRWDLYKETRESVLERVAACAAQQEIFVPSGTTLSIDAETIPTEIPPGTYYLSIQNVAGTADFRVVGKVILTLSATSSLYHRFLRIGNASIGADTFTFDGWQSVPKIAYGVLHGVTFGEENSYGSALPQLSE